MPSAEVFGQITVIFAKPSHCSNSDRSMISLTCQACFTERFSHCVLGLEQLQCLKEERPCVTITRFFLQIQFREGVNNNKKTVKKAVRLTAWVDPPPKRSGKCEKFSTSCHISHRYIRDIGYQLDSQWDLSSQVPQPT